MKRLAWLLAGLLVGAHTVHADEPDELSDITDIEQVDLADLLGSVTVVSRREESVFTAPASVTVLERSAIRDSGATTIPDLLRMVPGVQVIETGPGNYLVSLRGAGGVVANSLVVLLDGQPINAVVDATVDWGAIPVGPQQLQRIEVVRGPVSTVYGADAYTGVINLVTIAAPSSGVHAIAHAEAGLDASAHPYASTSVGVGGASGRWRWRFSLDGVYNDTFSEGGGGTRQPALRKLGATAYVEAQLRRDMTLSLRLGGAVDEHTSANHLVLESFPLTSSFGLGELRLRWKKPFSLLDSLDLWARIHSVTADTDASLYEGFAPANMRSLEWSIGFDGHFKLPKGFSADLGANAGWSFVSAPYLHPDVTGTVYASYGYYASVGVDIGKRLMLSLSTRGDGSAFLSGLVESYRTSIIYRRTKWSLRLSAGSGYRTPSYIETAGRFIDPSTGLVVLEGRTGLRPPQSDSVELGAIALVANRLTLRPTIYFQTLSNLMVEDFDSLTRKTFTNDKATRSLFGGEIEAELKLPVGLSLNGNFSGMYFLPVDEHGTPPTIGLPRQNSAFTAYLQLRSTLWSNRIHLALGALYMSSRAYDLRTGVPPTTLAFNVPNTVRLDGSANVRVHRRIPLSVYLKVRSNLPHEVQESPVPGASRLSTSVIVGLEYRDE